MAYKLPSPDLQERLSLFLNRLNDGDALVEANSFLDAGGDIDAPILPFVEVALLHEAAIHRRLQLVKLLAQRGANLNVRDAQGMTPMHFAIQHEVDGMFLSQSEPDFPCARLLLDLGASKDVIDNYGRTPRDLAGLYGSAMLDLFDEVMK